jgi:hypothetical protein
VRTAEPELIQAVVGSSGPLLGRGGGCYTKTLLLTIRLPMPTRIKSHRFASLPKGQRPSHSFGTHTCAHWLPGGWQAGTLWWWHLRVCRRPPPLQPSHTASIPLCHECYCRGMTIAGSAPAARSFSSFPSSPRMHHEGDQAFIHISYTLPPNTVPPRLPRLLNRLVQFQGHLPGLRPRTLGQMFLTMRLLKVEA